LESQDYRRPPPPPPPLLPPPLKPPLLRLEAPRLLEPRTLAPLLVPLKALPDEEGRLTEGLEEGLALVARHSGMDLGGSRWEMPSAGWPTLGSGEGRVPACGGRLRASSSGRGPWAAAPVEGRAAAAPVEGRAPALPVEVPAPPEPQPRASAVLAEARGR